MTAVNKAVQVRRLAKAGFSPSTIQEILGCTAGFVRAASYAPGAVAKAQEVNLADGSVVGWHPSMAKAERLGPEQQFKVGAQLVEAKAAVEAAKVAVMKASLAFQKDLRKSLGKASSIDAYTPRWTRELVAKGFTDAEILKCFYEDQHSTVKEIIRQLRG